MVKTGTLLIATVVTAATATPLSAAIAGEYLLPRIYNIRMGKAKRHRQRKAVRAKLRPQTYIILTLANLVFYWFVICNTYSSIF